jgi:hypothetical protein
MSLSGADRQAMIDELAVAGEWPDPVRDGVKALGGVWVKRWLLQGFDTEPTLAEVTAAKAAAMLAADRLAAKSAIETRAGAASFAAAASYDAGDGADEITAAGVAAWEAIS